MNANELADWLESKGSLPWADYFGDYLLKSSTMLRQQQERIEELEDKIDRYRDGIDNAIACLRGEA